MTRCEGCNGLYRPVSGDGPEPCQVLMIGERPGDTENKLGRPFIGSSGRELNENYLRLAGLRREEIRVTNTVKCWAEQNRKPSKKEVECCGTFHLPGEITECDPDLIVLLGGTACSLIPGLNLDIEHGIPRYADLFGWSGVVVPMYHPAAGLHDTGTMIPLLDDFERLGLVLQGKWNLPDDPYQTLDYRLLKTTEEVEHSFPMDACQVGIDTEWHGSTAFSIQYSFFGGTGRMILWEDQPLIRRFGKMLACQDYEVVFHNAAPDLDWLERMGVKVNRFRDTMQEAYHLGNLPQGLKALAYRLLGVRMRTYSDIVTPHSRMAIVTWMIDAINFSESALQRIEYKQLKTKIRETRKPGEMERGLRRIVRYTMENADYDPWDKLEELRTKDQTGFGSVEFELGPYPIEGIANAPLDEAVVYGCTDADLTLRVAEHMELMRNRLTGDEGEWQVMEGDADA